MTCQVDRASSLAIEHAAWSPTMDLLALSYETGEFSMVRTCMSWQVVWSVKEEAGDGVVNNLVWRTDGKVIAVSFTNLVNLYNVEGGVLIHSSSTTNTVQTWCSVTISNTSDHLQPVTPFIPQLEDVKTDITCIRELLECRGDLNVMMLCDETRSRLNLAIQGMLHVGTVDIPDIHSAGISPDGRTLCVVSSSNTLTTCMVYSTHSLSKNSSNINDVAMIYSKVLTFSEYLLSTFKAMRDCWDDLLSEFNKKLFAFHMSLHPSNLSEQFLHLLVTGDASLELETFLVHTLKEKEITKLLQSTLQSYQGIEKLISRNLMCCCYALSTQLEMLLGMSRWYDRYGDLSLKESTVQNSINKLSGLMIKSQELLQCISHSKEKLGAFLKWLLKATISLSDGNSAAVVLTEKEMGLVVKFLKNGSLFSKRADKTHFNIDTVWQYFSEESILVPPEYYNNKVLDTVLKILKDKKPYLTIEPSLSLVQSHKLFSDSLQECFDLNLTQITTPLHSIEITPLFSLSYDAKSLRFVDQHNIITMVNISERELSLINQSRHIIPETITKIFGYDRDFILITDSSDSGRTACICFEDDMIKCSLPADTDKIFISENRRLGAVISAKGRRVQIFDLDEDSGDDNDQ